MKVVVDTNIVFSAILNSQSWIGQIILRPNRSLKFFSPEFLKVEIRNHINKIKKITGLSIVELVELTDLLYTKIHFISEDLIIKEYLGKAEFLTKDVDFDDTLFIALALQFNCKLWTGDKELMNSLISKGFKKFITTQELLHKTKTS